MRTPTANRLNTWLRAHDGVITRGQAERLGISHDALRRLGCSGRLRRTTAGVFVDAAASSSPRTTLRAALVSAGRDAVVSHQSAAWLWGMVDRPPRMPHITIPRSRRVDRPGLVIHRTKNPPSARRHGGFPLTDPLRTIVDLAATWGDRPLDLLLDRGLSLRLLTIGQLQEAAHDPEHRRPGTLALRRRLTLRGLADVPHPSVLESHTTRLLERVTRRGGVPAPQREASVLEGRFRLDYAWPAIRLALEVDGYVWHSTPTQMADDLDRRNQLTRAGWTFLVYTWAQVVHDAEAVMTEIEATYRRLADLPRRPATG